MFNIIIFRRINELFANSSDKQVLQYKNEFDAAISRMQENLLKNVHHIPDYYHLMVQVAYVVSADEIMGSLEAEIPRRALLNFATDLQHSLGQDIAIQECVTGVKVWLMRQVQAGLLAQFMKQSSTIRLVLSDEASNCHSPRTPASSCSNSNTSETYSYK